MRAPFPSFGFGMASDALTQRLKTGHPPCREPRQCLGSLVVAGAEFEAATFGYEPEKTPLVTCGNLRKAQK